MDGNFIAPRILGSATGISGLWVLAAIVVGGGLFGIPGMVIGVPVLGVAANLAKAALPREPDGEKQNRTGKHSAEPVQHISPHCLHNVKIFPLEKPPLDVTIKL